MNIITAILNEKINEELSKQKDITIVCKDILYQEALLEILEKNKNIDFLILNSNLPGERKIIEIIKIIKEKYKKIKIILFTEKIEEDLCYLKVYKKYSIKELNKDLIISIIKNKKIKTNNIKKETIAIFGNSGSR